jgi:hypothetical protein
MKNLNQQSSPGPGEPTPTISVLVTCYNRREFLLDALRSVINQTLARHRYEVILAKNFIEPNIDRFASDHSIREVSMGDRPIGTWLDSAVHRARGEIICFLDDDDAFHPRKLEWVLTNFSRHPDLLYLHNGYSVVDSNMRPIPRRGIPRRWRNLRKAEIRSGEMKPRDLVAMASARGDYNTSSISVAKRLLAGPLGGVEPVIASTDSYLFFAAVAAEGSMILDPVRMTLLRIHSANSSGVGLEGQFELLEKIPPVIERHVADYEGIIARLGDRIQPEVRDYLLWAIAGARLKSALCTPKVGRKVTARALRSLVKSWNEGPYRETWGLTLFGLLGSIAPGMTAGLFSIYRMMTGFKTS